MKWGKCSASGYRFWLYFIIIIIIFQIYIFFTVVTNCVSSCTRMSLWTALRNKCPHHHRINVVKGGKKLRLCYVGFGWHWNLKMIDSQSGPCFWLIKLYKLSVVGPTAVIVFNA